MTELDPELLDFLHDCTRFGPTDINSHAGRNLERLGFVEYRYEGATLQARWRLTDKSRGAASDGRA